MKGSRPSGHLYPASCVALLAPHWVVLVNCTAPPAGDLTIASLEVTQAK